MYFKISSYLFIFIFLFVQNKAANYFQTTDQNVNKNNRIAYQKPIIPAYLADSYISYESGLYYLFATGITADTRYIPIISVKGFEFVGIYSGR